MSQPTPTSVSHRSIGLLLLIVCPTWHVACAGSDSQAEAATTADTESPSAADAALAVEDDAYAGLPGPGEVLFVNQGLLPRHPTTIDKLPLASMHTGVVHARVKTISMLQAESPQTWYGAPVEHLWRIQMLDVEVLRSDARGWLTDITRFANESACATLLDPWTGELLAADVAFSDGGGPADAVACSHVLTNGGIVKYDEPWALTWNATPGKEYLLVAIAVRECGACPPALPYGRLKYAFEIDADGLVDVSALTDDGLQKRSVDDFFERAKDGSKWPGEQPPPKEPPAKE